MLRWNLSQLLVVCVFISACARGPLVKSHFDNEVKELCAIDGGIKVYETATLPASMFDQYGNPKIKFKKYSISDDEYFIDWDLQYLRSETPQISRSHYKIVRRRDSKVMGDSIRYSRGGGDMFGPWHDSSFTCPEIGSEPSLEKSIFLKAENK